jgi:hypothetical protein
MESDSFEQEPGQRNEERPGPCFSREAAKARKGIPKLQLITWIPSRRITARVSQSAGGFLRFLGSTPVQIRFDPDPFEREGSEAPEEE